MKAKHRILAAGMAAAMTLSLAACGGSASTAEPTAILMISSDMPELISMSDRVLVVRDGRIDCELKGEQINEQEIIKRALGVNKDG